MDLQEKQQHQHRMLLERFGPDVGLTMELYDRVANKTASDAERREYENKADQFHKRVHRFIQETDVDNLSDDDADLLIAMISTGRAAFMEHATHVSKVVPHKGMENLLKTARDKNELKLRGFVGSSEGIDSLSPQQTVSDLGLDYEYQGETYYLRKVDGSYQPREDISVVKIPCTDELKEKGKIVMDPRLYEKVLARAETGSDPIRSMARDIHDAGVTPIYKAKASESKKDIKAKCDKFKEKFGVERVDQSDPPYRGLGFSSFGDRLDKGFLNLYPEMKFKVTIEKSNYQKYCGDGTVEYGSKFAKDDAPLDPSKPQGAVDVSLGTWDGSSTEISPTAGEEWDQNFFRILKKYPKERKAKLMQNKVLSLTGHGFAELYGPLPASVEQHLRGHSNRINSGNSGLSSTIREAFGRRWRKMKEYLKRKAKRRRSSQSP